MSGCVVSAGRVAVERMHVADEPALRLRQIRDLGVGRGEAGRGGVRVAGVARQQHVIAEPEQSDVSPDAGVILLIVHH